jgi:hypothetical protein
MRKENMAEKTVILIGNAWGARFHVPGFLRIEKLRQVGENRGEYYVVYDDSNLHDVVHVKVNAAFNGDLPPAGSVSIGTAYSEIMPGFGYIYYEVETSTPPSTEEFVMVVGPNPWPFYVKGLVAIDHVEPVDEWGLIDVVVRYSPNAPGADLRKVSIFTSDKPSSFGSGDSSGLVGIYYNLGLPKYTSYLTQIVPSTP